MKQHLQSEIGQGYQRMQDDQQAILDLLTSWQTASTARDLPKILSLMAEDAIFLVPGQPPMMGPEAFTSAFLTIPAQVKLEVTESRVEELHVEGNLAYCRCYLVVSLIPEAAGQPLRRSGYTLTLFRKKPDGTWVLTRDANMLTTENQN